MWVVNYTCEKKAIIEFMLLYSSGVTSGSGPPRVTPSRGMKLFFLWLNLERTLDKRRREVKMVRKRQLKKSPLCKGDYQKKRKKGRQFFRKNRRHRHQMRPRVAPTLVTPPLYSMALSLLLAFSPVFTGVDVVVDRRATELGSVWVWERSSHRLSIRTSLGTRHSVIRRVRVTRFTA